MIATAFAKLLTLNVSEEFKWFLRNHCWYRDVENLEILFQICALPGDIQKKKKLYLYKALNLLLNKYARLKSDILRILICRVVVFSGAA